MKKIFFVMLMGTLSLLSIQSQAQSDSKKFSVGFGFQGGLPLGDAKTAFQFNGGIDLRFSYKAGPGFATLSVGGNVFVPKSFDGVDTKAALQIPVRVGYKYKIVPHFFVMGEVGYSHFRSYYDDGNNQLVSSSTGGFTYAPAIGTEFGAFEAAVRYEGISVTGGTISYVALRLGFNF
ncbi:MAG: hypothetical protein ABJB86_07180 [Bacteroidota bacterium]